MVATMSGRTWRKIGIGVAALMLTGCAPTPASGFAPVETPTLRIPGIPLPQSSVFVVSPTSLSTFGCEPCGPGAPEAFDRFMYGTIPLGSVDALFSASGGAGTTDSELLGNIFVSGYFGGIFLRGQLASMPAPPEVLPVRPLLDAIGVATFEQLEAVVANVRDAAKSSDVDYIRSVAGAWALALAAIHGYNQGYLQVALQHPPQGAPIFPLLCATQFDCRTESLPLAALIQLEPHRELMLDPPDLASRLVTSAVESVADASVASGRNVWNDVLSRTGFSAASYTSIMALSVGFLEVTQAALLGCVAGAAGGDLAVARAGLRATAALVAWAGSYFLGLASPLDNSTIPSWAGTV